MKLIVGLGNPGKEYEKTRHNMGFMVIDNFAKSLGIEINKEKFNGLYSETFVENEKIILHSLNDKYDDIELTDQYDLNDSISVKGVFVGAIKSPLSCLDAE